jgi:hypothetical protein
VGVVLIVYGLAAIWWLGSFAWGGFLTEPIFIQALGFGSAVAVSLAGVALAVYGGYRSCRWRSSGSARHA